MNRQSTLIRIAAATIALLMLAACGGGDTAAGSSGTSQTATTATEDSSDLGAVGTLDSSSVHTIDVSFGQAEYGEAIEAYRATGDKEWIRATVTIDGSTYEQAGIRLKGNSSLFSLSASSDPATLPWLIKLDKYVDGQSHEGLTDLVVRSSNSMTALNEAVALELLDLAGLASQDAIAVAFSIDGGDAMLRLVIEHPDDQWMAEELDGDGALYKAESTGDYSYRGDDPDAYDEVFDQEAGKDNADLTPLIEFLDFINNTDDATFVAELDRWLDVEAFATYLAMQGLIDNFDDIDGPGNNSYLFYDSEAVEFTVVPWDHNLAFGIAPGPDDRAGALIGSPPQGATTDGDLVPPPPGEASAPTGDLEPMRSASGGRPPDGPAGRSPDGGSNVLVERFLADTTWAALVESRTAELRAELYDSGLAEEIVDEWSQIVAASGLVDAATIESEAAQIRALLAS